MKKIKIALLVLGVLLLVAFISRSFILKSVVAFGGSQIVGTKITIDKLDWQIKKDKIIFEGLKIYNPEGFTNEIMIEFSRIEVDYNISELFAVEPNIRKMIIDINEISVVKNKEGLLNINEFKLAKEFEKDNEDSIPVFPVKIDLLSLNMNQVVYQEYKDDDKPIIKTYDVGIENKEFKDVKSFKKIIALVLFNALGKTSIKGAKIYVFAAFLGPTFLPVGITGVLISKDHADGQYDIGLAAGYELAVEFIKDLGEIKEENIEKGLIKAKISKHDVSFLLESIAEEQVKVTVSARKLKIPKPEFAGGILYQFGKRLKNK